jgi:hypothetical protein
VELVVGENPLRGFYQIIKKIIEKIEAEIKTSRKQVRSCFNLPIAKGAI